MNKTQPRVMIAAMGSNSGKTYITCALLALLRKKGYEVSSFKCGPDYIDPMYHREIFQIDCGNLDTFFTEANMTQKIFARGAASDITIIEGVMGYFDGLGAVSLKGSSYDLACTLNLPVVLVVDCKGMGRTLCAQIKGMLEYEQQKHIKAVILNRISPKIYEGIKKQLEEELAIEVLGYLPIQKGFVLESRHLGLKQPYESETIREQFQKLADTLEGTFDWKAFLQLANGAQDLPQQKSSPMQNAPAKTKMPCKIAIAWDAAFRFYYRENWELLKSLGAELIYFSPLQDAAVPQADGMILGGGYPELYARELAENVTMKESILQAIKSGRPVLAECGGFMYLQQTLEDANHQVWNMVGALPGACHDTGRLQRFGYIELELPTGFRIKGHEFHYYDSTHNGTYGLAKKPNREQEWQCMVYRHQVLAGFPHLYYPSCPEFAESFLERCVKYREEKHESARRE